MAIGMRKPGRPRTCNHPLVGWNAQSVGGGYVKCRECHNERAAKRLREKRAALRRTQAQPRSPDHAASEADC